MKRGIILYVTEGRDALHDEIDLREQRRRLGVDAVCLATSEAEIAYGWWRMLTRGMQEISCMTAAYHDMENTLEMRGMPLRLCG